MSAVDALVDAFQANWSSHDPGAFGATCAADLHYEDPLTPEPIDGPDALGARAAQLWEAFPDARVQRTGERLTDGRFVAAPVKVLATHRGALGDVPATGRFVVVHAVLYCELDPPRELLWRVRAFFDAYGAATELGILPRPGSVSERALLMLRGFGLRARG